MKTFFETQIMLFEMTEIPDDWVEKIIFMLNGV